MSGTGLIKKNLRQRQRQMMLSGEDQAKAWKRWLDSADGISCSKGNANGEYLLNRLWYAFNAGVEVGLLAKKPKRIKKPSRKD